MDPVPLSGQRATRPTWIKGRPARLAGLAIAGIALLGVGILTGQALVPVRPSSLTAAIEAAAAGGFPCGPTQTLPTALKTVCGVNITPGSSGAGSATPGAGAKGGRKGVSPVLAIFGPGAIAGRILSISPSLIQIRSARGPIPVAIGPATQALSLKRQGPTLTTTPEPISGLAVGQFAVVVPAAPNGSGGARVAAYIYTRTAVPGLAA
ncbi:MAG TPA: hypothetical protein VNH82_05710 [Candidatus Dormibacteraeota bacterium]|nr:hypothetical protein [Candidatus Dormibacteraeota bacterium]